MSGGQHLRGQRLPGDRAVAPISSRSTTARESFTEARSLYWSRKGNPGYTVVFPFYWHSGRRLERFVPFYWHSTDSARSDLKVVLNVSWSSEPATRVRSGSGRCSTRRTSSAGPLPFLLTFNVGDSKIGDQYGALLGLYWWKRSQKGAFDFGFVPPYVSSRDAAHAFTWAAPLNFYWRNGRRPKPAGAAALLQERPPTAVTRSTPGSATAGAKAASRAVRRSGSTGSGEDDADKIALRRPVPAALELPRRRPSSTVLLPAGLELQRAEVEHDRRGPLHPRLQRRQFYFNVAVPALVERRRRRHRARLQGCSSRSSSGSATSRRARPAWSRRWRLRTRRHRRHPERADLAAADVLAPRADESEPSSSRRST